MQCTRKITQDLTWVGADDQRLAMFEGVYSVPKGVAYNSYLLRDEKTVLLDTVDKAVSRVFFENLAGALGGRALDYVVVQHMEPDHSATLGELLLRYPDATVVCSEKSAALIAQFFGGDAAGWHIRTVREGETLSCGRHTLAFYMAPMVHWPEVMVTYDSADKTLFSADAFGCFGALNGALFADEVDFMGEYLGEARRYYANIVGKYGAQVQSLLRKMAALDVSLLCPLHGFVWRADIGSYVAYYEKWSAWTPERAGVMIAYASVYGNTENAAVLLSTRLREAGVATEMFDVSVTPASEIVAAAFRWSHLLFASTTYNAGIFVTMDELLRDLAAHGLQNRTVALVENGSWAPASGKLMREILAPLRNLTILDETVSVRSALAPAQSAQLDGLVRALRATLPAAPAPAPAAGAVEPAAFFKLSYGLFVLTAREGDKDNGCIINTACQVTDTPKRISIAVNKANYTAGMIARTGRFVLSVLTEQTPFSVFEHFGFHSGRDTDKFAGCAQDARAVSGVRYIPNYTDAMFGCRVVQTLDCDTHYLFVGEADEARSLSEVPPATYAYYFAHIKPKPQPKAAPGKVWVCRICGYVYDEAKEGVPFEQLPADWTCPVCRHPKSDFELQAAKAAPAPGKVWVCRICGYVYDEAKEGVPFEQLPADWTCPLCKHPKSDFELQA
ncbi:MAG: rubredoxin [Oscillospiraceae bacterium]|nr:rubredoxin [Oscillospiraceae bacterium]